jgi:hypothetical protein
MITTRFVCRIQLKNAIMDESLNVILLQDALIVGY